MKESKFQFTNPKLDKLTFSNNENYKEEKDKKLHSSIKVNKQIIDDKNAIVKLIIEIGDKEDFIFYINMEMSAKFNWKDINENEVNSFLEVNAPALLLSYARPIIANVTMQSGLSPINLPFMNFTK
ncbi:protein-export chaperone SecB [Paraclostridium sordellii]|uniref:protein-export chaperone SecB n=1 Tax=Paraclostridium sordellii TaxID=1505 RepID=UPI0005E99B93|nr:protein-export chaperone SecB [Paeniclostridium sordellii]CEQ18981.1 preprotein translocase subunit SecB [[Clostridium] sordellii] [Paeniclostridium sordellii]